MSADSSSVIHVRHCLDRLRGGDAAALDPLIARAGHRRRWEAADGVSPNAAAPL